MEGGKQDLQKTRLGRPVVTDPSMLTVSFVINLFSYKQCVKKILEEKNIQLSFLSAIFKVLEVKICKNINIIYFI